MFQITNPWIWPWKTLYLLSLKLTSVSHIFLDFVQGTNLGFCPIYIEDDESLLAFTTGASLIKDSLDNLARPSVFSASDFSIDIRDTSTARLCAPWLNSREKWGGNASTRDGAVEHDDFWGRWSSASVEWAPWRSAYRPVSIWKRASAAAKSGQSGITGGSD